MKLKEYLQYHKMSVAKFSKKSGINASTLSGYIYHNKTPMPETMRTIYQVTDELVRPDDWIL
jgi:transcriptional regulator with XRE-family HTH domain|tara:strand:+ start:259 stop:444 length:186 start_codon:yes stop_codon:yes gene_type:complete